MNYNFDVKETKPKHRSWNAQLIPNRLIELAKQGTYYESRVIETI